jgi:hypothetical protein
MGNWQGGIGVSGKLSLGFLDTDLRKKMRLVFKKIKGARLQKS